MKFREAEEGFVRLSASLMAVGLAEAGRRASVPLQAEQDSTMGMIQRDTNGFWPFPRSTAASSSV